MEYLDQLYEFFRILLTTQVPVSLFTMASLMVVMGLFLLIARYKYGLMVSFLFVFLWAYVVNYKLFLVMFNYNTVGKAIYGVCGVLMISLFIISLAYDGRREL